MLSVKEEILKLIHLLVIALCIIIVQVVEDRGKGVETCAIILLQRALQLIFLLPAHYKIPSWQLLSDL